MEFDELRDHAADLIDLAASEGYTTFAALLCGFLAAIDADRDVVSVRRAVLDGPIDFAQLRRDQAASLEHSSIGAALNARFRPGESAPAKRSGTD